MGVFFWARAVALVEDLPLDEEYSSLDKLAADVDNGYVSLSAVKLPLNVAFCCCKMDESGKSKNSSLETYCKKCRNLLFQVCTVIYTACETPVKPLLLPLSLQLPAERLELLDRGPALPGDGVHLNTAVLDEQQGHVQRLKTKNVGSKMFSPFFCVYDLSD